MMMNAKEKKVINIFKDKIQRSFPGEIIEVRVFGSKARGDAKEESDIDVMVVTAFDDWKKGDKIRDIGYGLDRDIGSKLSIFTFSRSHVEYLKKNNFQFIKNVEREGFLV